MGNSNLNTGVGHSGEGAIKNKMLNMCTDYKVYWLWLKFAPELLPDKNIKTFKDLQNKYKKFPKDITEQDAEVWLYEKPVQNALKELLKSQHQKKMMELYDIYFDKAKTDVQAFRAFIDFSNTFFAEEKDSELEMLLRGIKIKDLDMEDE